MFRILSFVAFITIAIAIYSLLNYYFLKKHNNVIKLREIPSILWRLVLVTIILTPVATVIFSMNGAPFLAAVTGFTGYSWMAFLFLFLVIHGTADLVLFLMEKWGYEPSEMTSRALFILTLVINLTIMIYGSYEARNIQTELVEIQTDKLPPEKKELTIVQLSDIHFSHIISVETAEKITAITQNAAPDLVVSTGDLLDRGIRNPDEITRILRTIEAPLGKFAITGNHEFYAGLELSRKFTREAGFRMLRNEKIEIGSFLTVAGVDDPAYKQYSDSEIDISAKNILKDSDRSRYRILLKHQPRIEEESLNLFDLQLSGHTHAGQIFPFTLLVRIPFKFICGLYNLNGDTKIYVSRGTGTWGPHIRFLASPEVTVIRLIKR